MGGDLRRSEGRLQYDEAVSATLGEDVRRGRREVGSGRPSAHRIGDEADDLPRRLAGRCFAGLPRQVVARAARAGAQQRPIGDRADEIRLARAVPHLEPRHDFALAGLVRLGRLGRDVAQRLAEGLLGGELLERLGGQTMSIDLERQVCRCADLVGALQHRRLVVAEEESADDEPGHVRTTRPDPAQIVDLDHVADREAGQCRGFLSRNRFGLQGAAVRLDGTQVEDLRVGRNLRLAELRHAALVENARDGVGPFHRAAVRVDLDGALIEEPDRRSALGQLHRRVAREGEPVAVGPGQRRAAAGERDLAAQLQIAG